ncbi:hypothetical protein HHI36_004065 [Cryptolaemus montrouzieri]|uniref:Uncharacterized protein n=1 Tax=Cryptolaemus montrouzieri TaxID=559131 RepID=A0ABD2NQH5_9CUCU
MPVPVSQRYVSESSNSIDDIQPPVSVRDFQIILQQLELRQRRLERLHELTDPRRNLENRNYQQNPVYHRFAHNNANGPVQFVPTNAEAQRRRHYNALQARQYSYQDQQNQYVDEQFAQSYIPTKRVARLLKSEEESNENYLPPNIREMLLLKMLQLAINPAMPADNEESGTTINPVSYFKKDPSRNVEILGEESEPSRPSRVKRFKEPEDLEFVE